MANILLRFLEYAVPKFGYMIPALFHVSGAHLVSRMELDLRC